jgi:hypothetical protein
MEGIYLGHIGRLASAENCDFVLDVSVISFGVVQQLIASSSLVSQLRLGAPPAPQAVARILCRCRRHNDQRGQLEELQPTASPPARHHTSTVHHLLPLHNPPNWGRRLPRPGYAPTKPCDQALNFLPCLPYHQHSGTANATLRPATTL